MFSKTSSEAGTPSCIKGELAAGRTWLQWPHDEPVVPCTRCKLRSGAPSCLPARSRPLGALRCTAAPRTVALLGNLQPCWDGSPLLLPSCAWRRVFCRDTAAAAPAGRGQDPCTGVVSPGCSVLAGQPQPQRCRRLLRSPGWLQSSWGADVVSLWETWRLG